MKETAQLGVFELARQAKELLGLRPAVWVVRRGGFRGIASVKENGYAILEHVWPARGEGWFRLVQEFLNSVQNVAHKGVIVPASCPAQMEWLKSSGITRVVVGGVYSANLTNLAWETEPGRVVLPVREDDLAQACALYRPMPSPIRHVSDEVKHWRQVHAPGFLGFRKGSNQLCGVVFFHKVLSDSVWLRGLAVGKKWRHQGIGAGLVNVAVSCARRRGGKLVTAAGLNHRFWERLGFVRKYDLALCYRRDFPDT